MKFSVSYLLVLSLLFPSTYIFAFSSELTSRASFVFFQQGPGRGPIAAPRDLELEKQCEKTRGAGSEKSREGVKRGAAAKADLRLSLVNGPPLPHTEATA